jgi:hypothetical protein
VDGAEVIRVQLSNWQQADALGNSLRVLDCGPPNNAYGGDFRGAWFAVSVAVRYQFDAFV